MLIRPNRLKASSGNDYLAVQVANILRTYGTDAHVYLPGIGVINGLTAGNYLDSAGTTAATVDNPVGLVLDGAGSVGVEKVNDPSFITPSDWNPQTSDWVVSGGKATYTDPGSSVQWLEPITAVPLTAGKTYRLSLVISGIGASQNAVFGLFNQASSANLLGAYQTILANGSYEYVFTVASSTANIKFYGNSSGSSASWSADSISIKEVTGIHARQPTTADKMILRVTGGRYWWDAVDATDKLLITFPAGYESVTTIDASPTGQVTSTSQNIVGTYSITTDTYGRFIFKNITASELVVMQTFANRLAGL